ncbi:hypothetical protein [Catenovulum sediminis]|uniref:DNA-binding transcriptional repressor CapW winged helix-turn-helix domain-containing protein n=1 Tax=Catenovulum sediminis TaxID=1740262 RepID=A0ABV1RJQ9_9ALTE
MDIQQQYIHLNLYWLGKLTTSQLARHFQISLPTAKRLFAHYKNNHPNWITYNPHKKYWQPTQAFYLSNKTESLNQFFAQTNNSNEIFENPDQTLPSFEHLQLPEHYVAPDVFR